MQREAASRGPSALADILVQVLGTRWGRSVNEVERRDRVKNSCERSWTNLEWDIELVWTDYERAMDCVETVSELASNALCTG